MSGLQLGRIANIKVFGVGGGDCNAINHMVSEGVKDVEFYVTNTDLQALNISPIENKVVLGQEVTKGLDAGANPEMGKRAAQENRDEIREAIKGSDVVLIIAGLGGGTGTGAAPIFAKIAKEEGVLTVGIITKPFAFEGEKKMKSTEDGLAGLKQYVDSLIIISNNDLIEVIGRRPLAEAFQAAGSVLRQGVQAITDLITVPALINLDFANAHTIMENRSSALIGIGMAEGEDEARATAEKAIQSPLLEAQITGASNAIVNITGGESITLFDAEDAMALVQEAADNDINTIFGVAINEKPGGSIIATVIATGFDKEEEKEEEIPVASAFTQPVSRPSARVQIEGRPRHQELEEDGREDIPSFFSRR